MNLPIITQPVELIIGSSRHRTRPPAGALAMLTAAALLWQSGVAVAAPAQPKPQGQYVYKSVGHRTLTLDFDYPPDWKATDKRPAVVFFFGGGWAFGTPLQFQPQAEYLAKRGLVCARADYRVRSRDGVTPDKCVEDALSAMRWVRAHATQLGIDPHRLVAAGGSAGGHLAACSFFATEAGDPADDKAISPKPNAMILYNPALDMVALRDVAGGKFCAGLDEATLKRISPLLQLSKEAPPTLLIDGTKDFLNPQVREFVRQSKALGAPVQTFYAQGQPHGFFNKSPWLEKTTEAADEFLQAIGYLSKGPQVPLPTRQGQEPAGK